MLSAESFVNQTAATYPAELQARVRADLLRLIERDRHYLLSQVQYALSRYHRYAALDSLRADIDQIFDLTHDPTELDC